MSKKGKRVEVATESGLYDYDTSLAEMGIEAECKGGVFWLDIPQKDERFGTNDLAHEASGFSREKCRSTSIEARQKRSQIF
jgi:hypothetical protein